MADSLPPVPSGFDAPQPVYVPLAPASQPEEPAVAAPYTPSGNLLRDLLESYRHAIWKPRVPHYRWEMGRASWARTGVGIAALTIASLAGGFLASLYLTSDYDRYITMLQQMGMDTGWLRTFRDVTMGAGVWLLLRTVVWVPLYFLLEALLVYGIAVRLGGRIGGATFGQRFGTHAYLYSLSYVPLTALPLLFTLIPFVGVYLGGGLALGAVLYRVYCVHIALRASHGLNSNRALLAAAMPLLISFVFGLMLGLVIAAAVVFGTFSAVSRSLYP